MVDPAHVLTIVIPALNEEAAIGDTVKRCLAARETITALPGVAEVEVIVVSDGSTDSTEAIAQGFDEVTVLAFEENRGYGAAIKCGFAHGRGDLVGFLDADGTCDPLFFADLCRAIDGQSADLVLGSRMGPQSEMPFIRTVGNTLFALLLGALSKRSVQDTASGMRVIRRAALPDLYPLPDGLHFTPAMSARVLLEDKLRLVEIPMAYAERVGSSKLHVARDGVRFLFAIVQAATALRPARPLLLVAALLVVLAAAAGSYPLAFYLENGWLREWMIYRVLLSSLLATLIATVVCGAVVAERIAAAAHGRSRATRGVTGVLSRCFTRRGLRLGGLLLGGLAVVTVWPGLVTYVSRGEVDMHWSRVVLASLLVAIAGMLAVTTFLLHMMELIRSRAAETAAERGPDRVRSGSAAGPATALRRTP